MMPDQLKLNELGGFGYDQYVADAAKQVESMAKVCGGFDWPQKATGGQDGNDATVETVEWKLTRAGLGVKQCS